MKRNTRIIIIACALLGGGAAACTDAGSPVEVRGDKPLFDASAKPDTTGGATSNQAEDSIFFLCGTGAVGSGGRTCPQ